MLVGTAAMLVSTAVMLVSTAAMLVVGVVKQGIVGKKPHFLFINA